VRINVLQPLQREMLVIARIALPVKRHAMRSGLHPVPAHGQPQLGPLIAFVRHELHHFTICHQPAGQLEGRDINRVARCFIVKGKRAIERRIEAMLYQPAVVAVPAQRLGRRAGQRPTLSIGRALRIE